MWGRIYMENIWFYTLSTSSQVLAALAGLFAVFVVWKIQDFEKLLSETRLAIINIISNISANTKNYSRLTLESLYLMSDLQILEKFSELLDIKENQHDRITIAHTVTGDSYIHYTLDPITKDFYKKHIDKKLSILKDLKMVLIVNFLVLTICILALTFSSYLNYNFLILLIINFAVIVCVCLVGFNIYKITVK
jgi:hypothetical protein